MFMLKPQYYKYIVYMYIYMQSNKIQNVVFND